MSLTRRESKTNLHDILIDPDSAPKILSQHERSKLEEIAESMKESRSKERPVVFAFGAHLIKNGLSRIMIELMKFGYVQQMLVNEAVVIHDWEFAFQGKTEENVARYIEKGQFGLWDETGRYIGNAIKCGVENGIGYGHSVGRFIENGVAGNLKAEHPYKEHSVVGQAFRMGIPLAVGVNLGQAIIHKHPGFDWSVAGRASQIDIDRFDNTIYNLEGGVYLSIGSAVLSPQIFEKSLSAAKNVGYGGKNIRLKRFRIYVNDIQPSTWDWSKGEPPKDNPAYYLRFMKTFSRMGGRSEYIEMDNVKFLHNLYHLLK